MNKNKTTYKILQLLADGHFHSGQKLGQTLNITRSGIWKAIKQLEQLNIEVHAVTGKGYRIPQGIELLDETEIKKQLDPKHQHKIKELILLLETTSTNDYLLKLAKLQPQNNLACSAEYQTAARGRNGQSWITSFASSIYQSVLWHFNKDPSEIVGLSLAVAVCVVRVLKQYGIDRGVHLKWPNDVLWEDKKLAGILIDLMAEPHGRCSVVVGIGLNVNIPYQLGTQIGQPWIDIATITQQQPARNRLAGLLLNELVTTLETFDQHGLAPFIAEWNASDKIIGKNVTLSTPQGKVHGVMQGISPTGELILLTENNETKHYLSGEISLRLTQGV